MDQLGIVKNGCVLPRGQEPPKDENVPAANDDDRDIPSYGRNMPR
jgi:hypothetical protein